MAEEGLEGDGAADAERDRAGLSDGALLRERVRCPDAETDRTAVVVEGRRRGGSKGNTGTTARPRREPDGTPDGARVCSLRLGPPAAVTG